MKNRLQGFIIGVVVSLIIMSTIPTFAESTYKNIDVLFNFANIVVNGEKKDVDNLNYNGSTYVKLRSLSDIFGKDIEYDGNTKTVYIDEKDSPKLVRSYPQNNQNNFYTTYNGYLFLIFSKAMKPFPEDLSQISIISESGERVNVKSVNIGTTTKTSFLVFLDKELKLNTKYSLKIPGGTFESEDGHRYSRDIDLRFSTPETVLLGKINTSSNPKVMYLSLNNGSYRATIEDGGLFTFGNVDGGKYILKLVNQNNQVYEQEITVEKGIVNKIDVFPNFK